MLQLFGQCSQIDFFFKIYSLGEKKKKKDGDDKVQGGQGILGWKCGDCNLRYDSQDGPH